MFFCTIECKCTCPTSASNNAPHNPMVTPATLLSLAPNGCSEKYLNNKMATTKQNKPHNNTDIEAVITRDNIQIAMLSIKIPNSFFITSIQGPVLGNHFPADTPMISNGMPMPIPSANKATPPSSPSPVSAI